MNNLKEKPKMTTRTNQLRPQTLSPNHQPELTEKIMNAKKLIVAISLLAAGSAFADDVNYPYVKFDDFQSTTTRAEVMAELQQAKADGSYVVGGNEFKAPDAHFVSTKTRTQVLAELREAQRDGAYVVGGNEYEAPVANFISTKTRAHVLAELQDAQRNGTYVVGGEAWVGQYSAPDTARAGLARNASNDSSGS
jgi:hypothetical protein